jgi:hypothetical protein
MKSVIYLFILIFLAGCYNTSFNYKPDKVLKERYAYSQKAGDIVLYYNTKLTNSEKIIELNIKNVSNLFVKSLSVDISDDSGKLNRYLFVGNIKNLSSKTVNIEVNKEISKLNLTFRYELMPEDAFLNQDKGDLGVFEKIEKTVLIVK